MEKTLTFTVEDALLSPVGFAVLSGAGLFQGEYGKKDTGNEVHVHKTTQAYSGVGESLDLTDALGGAAGPEKICKTAPIFVVAAEKDGSVTGDIVDGLDVDSTGKKIIGKGIKAATNYFVDYYVVKPSKQVDELQIDAENFAGYYYVEASTLFRRQDDGKDMPAELTFPNVKIQSNFTFSMASTGDPSTFTFTMDAFPGYTYFEPTRKVLCAIQMIDESISGDSGDVKPVFPHEDGETIEEAEQDSVSPAKVMDQNVKVGLGEMTVDKLMAPGTIIFDNGNVTAELLQQKTKPFTDFSSNSEEQKGYYFPVQIDASGAKKMKISKTSSKGTNYSDVKEVDYDDTIVVRVANESGKQLVYDLKVETFSDDDKKNLLTVTELHFNDMTFTPEAEN